MALKSLSGRNSWLKNKDGNFGVWFGIMALPIVLAVGYGLEFTSAESDYDALKAALDTASLAAVSNNSISDDQRKSFASETFKQNYQGKTKIELSVDVSPGKVAMVANGKRGATVTAAAGHKGIELQAKSTAIMNHANTICVLGLSTKGKGQVKFAEDAEFNSPNCSVQSNSTDPEGMISDSSFVPNAQSFCSAGGAVGPFSPYVKGECNDVIDPYEYRTGPTPGVCLPPETFNVEPVKSFSAFLTGLFETITAEKYGTGWASGEFPDFTSTDPDGDPRHPNNYGGVANDTVHVHWHSHDTPVAHTAAQGNPPMDASGQHSHVHGRFDGHHAPDRLDVLGYTPPQLSRLKEDYDEKWLNIKESGNYTGHDGVFYPGTYCGGLTVDGRNVTFMPGEYIMLEGPLTFKNGATANADGVSFIMNGLTSVVTVESGAQVYVRAPKIGPMAGLAFFEDVKAKKAIKNSNLTWEEGEITGVNILSSGGGLNVVGTIYMPTMALDVSGDSVLGARAPATSFIASRVAFAGKTKAEISVDHVKAGLPPMLPQSDDGARLIE